MRKFFKKLKGYGDPFDSISWLFHLSLLPFAHGGIDLDADEDDQAEKDNHVEWKYPLYAAEDNLIEDSYLTNPYYINDKEKNYTTLDAKPIVCFLGNSVSAKNFSDNGAEELSRLMTTFNDDTQEIQPYRVYWADYPGAATPTYQNGKKVYLDTRDSTSTLVDFAANVCNRVAQKHPNQPLTIVGCSVGGWVTQQLLKYYGDNPNAKVDFHIEKVILSQTLSSVYDVIASHAYGIGGSFYKLMESFVLFSDHHIRDTVLYAHNNPQTSIFVVDADQDEIIRTGQLGRKLLEQYNNQKTSIRGNLRVMTDNTIDYHGAGTEIINFYPKRRHMINEDDKNAYDQWVKETTKRVWTTICYDPTGKSKNFPLYFLDIDSQNRSETLGNNYLKFNLPNNGLIPSTEYEGISYELVAFLSYIVFIAVFWSLLALAWVADLVMVPFRSYNKFIRRDVEHNEQVDCFQRLKAGVQFFIATVWSWFFVSMIAIFRLMFYPVFVLRSATHNVHCSPINFSWRIAFAFLTVLIGTISVIPMFSVSIFVVLCLAKLTMVKFPHFLDHAAEIKWPSQIRWLQKDIPVVSKCYHRVKLPGISASVNNMLHHVVVDGLLMISMAYLFCVTVSHSVRYWKGRDAFKNAVEEKNRHEQKLP